METIKIKYTKTIEREIKVPLYLQFGSCYYKVITACSFIKVFYMDDSYFEIAYDTVFPNHAMEHGVETTEEKFNEVYNKVKSLL
jgi:hypothetical protein